MKKLNILAIIFGIGLFVSCSKSDVEEEIGLETKLFDNVVSNCPIPITEPNQGYSLGPIPPLPPCF